MKLHIYLSLCFIGLLATSCIEDESNEQFSMRTPIVIDLNKGPESYTIVQYSRLRIAPLVYREGLPDADLAFKWELIGTDLREEIGHEMVFDDIIHLPASPDTYTIMLTVTDKTSGIINYHTWQLQITGTFASGIVVADTKDDGRHSDLSLIRCYNFSTNWQYYDRAMDVRYENICSSMTGNVIDGKVVVMQNPPYSFYKRYLTVATDQSLFRLDPQTFQPVDSEKELFSVDPQTEKFLSTYLSYSNVTRQEHMLMNGKVYSRSTAQGNKSWGYYLYMAGDQPDYNATAIGTLETQMGQNSIIGYIFDASNGRFLQVSSNDYIVPVKDGSGKFNPNNIGKHKECIYMGEALNRMIYAVVKDNTDPAHRYELYRLNCVADDGTNNVAVSVPTNLSSATDIDQARCFIPGMADQNILFYATKDKIYSVNVLSPEINKLAYELPENEEITSMRIWKSRSGSVHFYYPQDLYPGFGPYYRSNGDLYNWLVVITTYNPSSKEGKLRCFAQQGLGTGLMCKESEEVYGGFGRILGWCEQGD